MKTIILHTDALRSVGKLPPEDAITIINAMADLAEGGDPQVPSHLEFGWSLIKEDILQDIQSYNAKCEKNRKNIAKRYAAKHSTNVYDGIRPNTMVYDGIQSNTTEYDGRFGTTILYNTKLNNTIQDYTKQNYQSLCNININKDRDSNNINNNIMRATSDAHRSESAKKKSSYPETTEDILAIAKNCGVQMSKEEADVYLAVRSSGDWYKQGYHNRIPVGQIGADIKIWHEREEQKKRDNTKKDKDIFRDGKHIADYDSTTDNNNDNDIDKF